MAEKETKEVVLTEEGVSKYLESTDADAVADKVGPFDMDASKYDMCYCGVLFSKTIVCVYLPIIVLLLTGWLVAGGYLCK